MTLTNPLHLLFVGIVALLVLGPKRLPEVARSLGQGLREFRESLNGERHPVAGAVEPPPPGESE